MRSAVWLLATLVAGPLASAAPAAAQTSASSPESLGDFLKPGDKVAPFEAAGIDGVTRRVDFPKKTVTVLMFFSSGCPHCHHMIPIWNDRYRHRASNVAMIGIIVDKEPPGFFEQLSILFPVLRMPSREMLTDFKVARVPLMLRVAPGGVVEEVGVGILDPIRLGQILRP
jgi:peroxiredoxin